MLGLLHWTVWEQAQQLRAVAQTRAALHAAGEATAARARKLRKQIQTRQRALARHEYLAQRQRAGARFLTALEATLPRGIRLNQLQFRLAPRARAPALKITGVAGDIGAAARFAARLQEVEDLGRVSLRKARRARNARRADAPAQFVIEFHATGEAG